MGEFSKFSIQDLNTVISVIDEVKSQGASIWSLKDLITKEINSRTNHTKVLDINDLRAKYLGKYVGYKGSDEIMYFRIDNINHFPDLDIIAIESKLVICEDDDWFDIHHSLEGANVCNLSPQNLDMRDFFDVSETEFKEKLNKIITNGLA